MGSLIALTPPSHTPVGTQSGYKAPVRFYIPTEIPPLNVRQNTSLHNPLCVFVSVVFVRGGASAVATAGGGPFFKEYHRSVEGERSRLERCKSVLKAKEKQLDDAFQVSFIPSKSRDGCWQGMRGFSDLLMLFESFGKSREENAIFEFSNGKHVVF